MAVSLTHLEKSYQDPSGKSFRVLGPIDLRIETGEFLCLLGPTGCGKTTLLRILSGLEQADSGKVSLGAGRFGYVFQQGALFPWMNVESNVMFPLKAKGMTGSECRSRAAEMLNHVGLYGFSKSFPHELSGGMQQRTALARGLVTEPELLLLDEPFASLDTRTGINLQEMLRAICGRLSTTVIYVTHSIEEAVYLADRIVVMGHSPGRIVRNESLNLKWPRSRLSSEFTEILLSFRQTFEKLVDPSATLSS
ncbi:MAG: ABC transporter ATP-binding protein [Candidatus Sabulitectum sp.]|nr:ABC transporter ATP-binding protein [Candidatus Sabulitectum sp.]